MSNLALTTILDPCYSRQWRSCCKLWTASLLRHQWEGRIHIERNFSQLLFPVSRTDLHEVEFVPNLGGAQTKEVNWMTLAREHQLEAAGMMAGAEAFEWILFADADCVATQNVDHLFVGDCDLLVSSARGLPDPGFVAVRGELMQKFVSSLRFAGGLTGSGLATIMKSGEWKVREYERGEVLRPDDPDVSLSDLANAAVIHFSGMKAADKYRLAFAFHMMAVYGDRDGLFFDMIEA